MDTELDFLKFSSEFLSLVSSLKTVGIVQVPVKGCVHVCVCVWVGGGGM